MRRDSEVVMEGGRGVEDKLRRYSVVDWRGVARAAKQGKRKLNRVLVVQLQVVVGWVC